MSAHKNTIVIIGAGPAGLTAALELQADAELRVIILEALEDVGGISRTILYKGNRMDIGGHRFFSKSDWVMRWWQNLLPIAPQADENGISRIPVEDAFMLVRSRLSRIYFLRRFFNYPISLSLNTMRKLGPWRLLRIGLSYSWARIFPRHPERNLEDFFLNRFGQELYRTFFKDYTEKVWGTACRDISAEWGAQRIKGLSVLRAIRHAFKRKISGKAQGVEQKEVETSLIEKFLYPKHGPGQIWHAAAQKFLAQGGEIYFGHRVNAIALAGDVIKTMQSVDAAGTIYVWSADYFISSMPIQELVAACTPLPPPEVVDVASGLLYRDFITVGLKLRKLRPAASAQGPLNLLPDTWIYIQEPTVKLGRLQIFNNWSPALVNDPDSVWLGLEYFCQENDALWRMSDEAFARFAMNELALIDLIDPQDVLDFHVVRVPKAYPAYFGSYDRFNLIRQWSDRINNLYLIGRNGMHRYNNQDHSMLTARVAAEAIRTGQDVRQAKQAIWAVNAEQAYHEEKPQ